MGQFVLIMTLISPYAPTVNSQVFYAKETCELAKGQWLKAVHEVSPNAKAVAQCTPRSVSQFGSVNLDKDQ